MINKLNFDYFGIRVCEICCYFKFKKSTKQKFELGEVELVFFSFEKCVA